MGIERINRIADYGSGWVLWVLVIASVVALAIVVERLVLFLSSRDNVPRLRREVRALLERQDVAGARKRLGTLGSNAPFVGLLGTVIGVVRAFDELSAATGQVTAGLLSEIGEALIATAVGILVAIPAIAFFNLFQRAIKVRLGQSDALGREVLAYLKSGGAAPAAAE
jgi:biopolymer transport protein ExbB